MTDMPDPDPCRILIIDDEAGVALTLARSLEKRGCRVDTVEDGLEGIRKASLKSYDAVISDVRMPGPPVSEVVAEIRRIQGPNVPVIGISGTPWLIDPQLFDAVLPKPFLQKELLAVLGSVLPGRGSFPAGNDERALRD